MFSGWLWSKLDYVTTLISWTNSLNPLSYSVMSSSLTTTTSGCLSRSCSSSVASFGFLLVELRMIYSSVISAECGRAFSLPIKDQSYKIMIITNFPACGDDVLWRDWGPLDELADKLEANASRGSCDEDTTCEHSGFCALESFLCFQVKVVYIGQMSNLLSRSSGMILADPHNLPSSARSKERIIFAVLRAFQHIFACILAVYFSNHKYCIYL